MNGLEALENWYNTEKPKPIEYSHHYNIIKKELKVLQILKENCVDLDLIDYLMTKTTTLEELLYRYNDRACDWVGDLTLEEMQLIVEWLKGE